MREIQAAECEDKDKIATTGSSWVEGGVGVRGRSQWKVMELIGWKGPRAGLKEFWSRVARGSELERSQCWRWFGMLEVELMEGASVVAGCDKVYSDDGTGRGPEGGWEARSLQEKGSRHREASALEQFSLCLS